MTAPTQKLPTLQAITSLPKPSQIAYAVRCALRAEPLYAEMNPDPLRAKFVRACIETATNYFATRQFSDVSSLIDFDPSFADYGVQAAVFAAMAAEDAFNADNDPDYDSDEAEFDEATPAHRVESAATFSLLAAYDTHLPLDEARRAERLALAAVGVPSGSAVGVRP